MKIQQTLFCSLAVIAVLAGCQQETEENSKPETELFAAESQQQQVAKAESSDVKKVHNPIDNHTYGNLHEVDLKHLDLNLTVDFEAKSLKGYVDLSFDRLKEGVSELILDTRDIDISKVELNHNEQWIAGEFDLAEKDEVMGSKLTIKLEDGVSQVRVHYATQPQASGLQWLTPEQTDGNKHPFMYSQAQAIHARSFVPVQDSPAVRITYNATIRTPKQLLAVMSAHNEPDTELDGEYHFEMPQAIPTYLIAIGVGDLKFKAMSDRTGVYAEPAILDSAVAEFDDTENMVKVTEELYGPYRWGRYDLLILPPAFPYGGMENPRLSFITPTVIAGDKSLVSLIAHELAHSWSGNLVTNANWHDFWLNEGFTSYVENRIMEELFGRERALMEQSLAVQDLRQAVQDLPKEYTVLNVDLKGADPDDAFSTVPYTKGQMFLVWLEEKFGREVFDAFLVKYFDHFAFQSITTQQFKVYLKENLLDKHPGVVSDEEIDTWIHEPMLPEMMPSPTSDAFKIVDQKTKQLLAGEITLTQLGTHKWTVHEWLHFINNLPAGMSTDDMMAMDAQFELTESTNNEIAHAWLLLSLKAGYDVVMPRLEDYLVSIGRRKLIVPLYKQLMETEQGAEFAKRVYQVARPGYHPLAQATLDAIVK